MTVRLRLMGIFAHPEAPMRRARRNHVLGLTMTSSSCPCYCAERRVRSRNRRCRCPAPQQNENPAPVALTLTLSQRERGFSGQSPLPRPSPLTRHLVPQQDFLPQPRGLQDRQAYLQRGLAPAAVVRGERPAPAPCLIETVQLGVAFGSFTIGTALRRRAFWHLLGAMTLTGLGTTPIMTLLIPGLLKEGFPIETAVLAAGAIPLVSIPGRLCFGWWGDYLNKQKLLAASFTN